MNEEEAAEFYFFDWFKNHLQPRAAALNMIHMPTILFEVIFPIDTDRSGAFYTEDDWIRSESIIFPDGECNFRAFSCEFAVCIGIKSFLNRIDGDTCDGIASKLALATDNAEFGFQSYTPKSSRPAQRVLCSEIQRISEIKETNSRLVQFLALVAVFQYPLFWIMNTKESGKCVENLLSPLGQLYTSLMKLPNSELLVDDEGRKYVHTLMSRFTDSIQQHPSPLYRDGIKLDWTA